MRQPSLIDKRQLMRFCRALTELPLSEPTLDHTWVTFFAILYLFVGNQVHE